MYRVKEIFHTLQGEGAHAGRSAVFCRFSGCNLWTGHERHRARAICKFCDTDFVGTDGTGGGRFRTADALAAVIASAWPTGARRAEQFVVCTGGEPLIQLDQALVDALHGAGFTVAIETNGTRPAPSGIDWICVSPKGGAELVLTSGDELKLVFPQHDAPPSKYEGLGFKRFSLQPMAGPELDENTRLAVAYCMAHPPWRLSLQTHKTLGIR